jgi:hypothetical protein
VATLLIILRLAQNGVPLANTYDPAIYRDERWASGNLDYKFTVANGNYNVNLKFAELYYTQPGQRVLISLLMEPQWSQTLMC